MQIPPFLERLLLTNEAEFRNATLGLNGGNLLQCPVGKSLIILEMSIQPFVNVYNSDVNQVFIDGWAKQDYDDFFREYSRRKIFQVQLINDKYNQYFSFTDAFKMTPLYIAGDIQHVGIGCELEFLEKRESLYIYADRSLYFNFLYYVSDSNTIQFVSEVYGTSYKQSIQAQSPFPITPENSISMTNLHTFENSTKSLAYFPLKKEQTPSLVYTPSAPGQSEGFRLVTAGNPDQSINITQVNQGNIALDRILTYQLPLINVKYALVNKRPSDYGLIKP